MYRHPGTCCSQLRINRPDRNHWDASVCWRYKLRMFSPPLLPVSMHFLLFFFFLVSAAVRYIKKKRHVIDRYHEEGGRNPENRRQSNDADDENETGHAGRCARNSIWIETGPFLSMLGARNTGLFCRPSRSLLFFALIALARFFRHRVGGIQIQSRIAPFNDLIRCRLWQVILLYLRLFKHLFVSVEWSHACGRPRLLLSLSLEWNYGDPTSFVTRTSRGIVSSPRLCHC